MTSLEIWNAIVNSLLSNSIEFPTVPKTQKIPVWFSATTDGKTIFINKAINHNPSCQISVQRKLKYSTFQKVYPLYLRRENGERISAEVTAVTVNQVYYFSLIKHFQK